MLALYDRVSERRPRVCVARLAQGKRAEGILLRDLGKAGARDWHRFEDYLDGHVAGALRARRLFSLGDRPTAEGRAAADELERWLMFHRRYSPGPPQAYGVGAAVLLAASPSRAAS